ncbi:MAG TPA: orotate phosphoribosyltransferase [Clostridiales bacterium]|nr:orotate phosphoribosyltransferase [Clostridiales bacterium]
MKRQIAADLLSIGAVFLRPEEPFTWASGIKSPIYCDNRLILTEPPVRNRVEQVMKEVITTTWPECELIMGTATAGIAHAAIAAHLMGLPMGYVRSGAKDHGRGNRIEGRLLPGQKTVLVEDLISTGGSVINAAKALREAGAEILGVVSIFTYGMAEGGDSLARAGLQYVSLTDFDVLVEIAAELGYIKSEDVKRLIAFRDNPTDESWMKGRIK